MEKAKYRESCALYNYLYETVKQNIYIFVSTFIICIRIYMLIHIIGTDTLGNWNWAYGGRGQKGDSSQYTFQIFDIKTMWTYYQLHLRILISMNNRISRITSNQVNRV